MKINAIRHLVKTNPIQTQNKPNLHGPLNERQLLCRKRVIEMILKTDSTWLACQLPGPAPPAISMWFANGMSEHDVMVLAGHSSFATTHKFYLAVADDLVHRARVATAQGLRQKLVHFGTPPLEIEKWLTACTGSRYIAGT